MSARAWWIAGCIMGLLAVAFGAMAAHSFTKQVEAGLKTQKQLEWLEVGVRYAAYHAPALLAVAWLAARGPSRATTVAGGAFLAGVTLFTGSLLLMAYTGTKALPVVLATPLGGTTIMVGWIALAVAGHRALAEPKPAA